MLEGFAPESSLATLHEVGAGALRDGLSVEPTSVGARLRCAPQRLEAEATSEGLWLVSKLAEASEDRFRVAALTVGRAGKHKLTYAYPGNLCTGSAGSPDAVHVCPVCPVGEIQVGPSTVCFIRPGLIEEYSVSRDGVRQDFIVAQRPAGEGDLRIELDLEGAGAEPTAKGVRLLLDGSGRSIAYARLHAEDATGRSLKARIEVVRPGRLAVFANDANAIYPIRIDPTFSDANWVSMGGLPGTDGIVSAAVVDGYGNLYIGGTFTVAGNTMAANIAKWDGSNWSALGSGMNTSVLALAVSGTNLYAGGRFTNAGGSAAAYIAKWDGTSWSAFGSGLVGTYDPFVSALAVSGTGLYVGGRFTMAGGGVANSVAIWDGGAWSALGPGVWGVPYPIVYALAVSGSNLYAGGSFTGAGDGGANHVGKWDGSSWTPLGSGINGTVYSLASSGSNLYAGGVFNGAGGGTVNSIAGWDGSSWSSLGSGAPGAVYSLTLSGTNLYVGGNFTTAGGIVATNIAIWDGNGWSAFGSGPTKALSTPAVWALAVSGSDLYAGGDFTDTGSSAAANIAKWSGGGWSALGPGMGYWLPTPPNGGSPFVSSLTVSGDAFFAGGVFTTAGTNPANAVARWNGTNWSALGSGMGGSPFPIVYALAASGSHLYAGGYFTSAGGATATNIAKWDGSGWSAFGSGANNTVRALAASARDIYAAGQFSSVGGTNANCVAKWNGTNWSPLGTGLNNEVDALCFSGSNLYAGGIFTSAGGSPANRVARWDGHGWSALGSGVDSAVYALAASSDYLYAGGYFTNAGGTEAHRVAKWDGNSWSALGSGVNFFVRALATSGSELYAAGNFTTAGGEVANSIARWDGTNWSALGSGMGPWNPIVPTYVYSLAIAGSDLYAGGNFTSAGGKASAYVARAYLERPTLSILPSGREVTLTWPSFYVGFALQQNSDVANSNSWMAANLPFTTNGAITSATAQIGPTNLFFRLIGD